MELGWLRFVGDGLCWALGCRRAYKTMTWCDIMCMHLPHCIFQTWSGGGGSECWHGRAGTWAILSIHFLGDGFRMIQNVSDLNVQPHLRLLIPLTIIFFKWVETTNMFEVVCGVTKSWTNQDKKMQWYSLSCIAEQKIYRHNRNCRETVAAVMLFSQVEKWLRERGMLLYVDMLRRNAFVVINLIRWPDHSGGSGDGYGDISSCSSRATWGYSGLCSVHVLSIKLSCRERLLDRWRRHRGVARYNCTKAY